MKKLRKLSNSVPERDSPQYAHALAILSGGIAFITPQLGAPIAAWLSYALLAMLFGSIWPYRAWQWGCWLCLPMALLICFNFIVAGNLPSVFFSYVPVFAQSLSTACLGAYLGSKFSIRKIANRSASRRASGKRLSRNGNGVRSSLVSKKLASPPSMISLPVSDVEMLGNLFSQGAGLDAADYKGWTALMIATIEGHVEVARGLLEHGADVNATNSKGWAALRFAVSMDETEILQLLLDAGADANIADHEGRTALMQAAGENIRDSLKVLLDTGADPHLKDHNEQTALTIAQKHGHTEIIKLLKEAIAKFSTDIDFPINIPDDRASKVADKTHRVIKMPRDQFYGLLDRYDVIPRGDSLPSGCDETGFKGTEEECWHNVWKSSIGAPAELGWWLHFNN